METRSKTGVFKPNPKFGLTFILSEVEPETSTQALKNKKWRRTMSDEADAFVRNDMFDLVDRSEAKNIVGSKWIFRIKCLPDGSIDKYKARLVTKGFHQRPGVDFHETFSPVIKLTTIKLVLGTAVGKNWPFQQLDTNNVFLQGLLDEEVYMLQPPGLKDKDKPNHVSSQKGSLWLKTSPQAWYTVRTSW